MSKGARVSRAAAQATLEAYTMDVLGGPLRAAHASPRVLRMAITKAEGMLNRQARRALGARGDYRFHWLVTGGAVPRSRNAA